MGFAELKDFLANKMRMSHVYQPVVIRELLKNDGRVASREIASKIAADDPTQIDYYERILKVWPKKTLGKHQIASLAKGVWTLDVERITAVQKDELIAICEQKIEDYLAEAAHRIYEHRSRGLGAVPGSVRFEVFKAAGHKCSLCGVSAGLKALEVDHILPKNRGGSDDISNLQALCYSCNAAKRDTDATDFRDWDNRLAARIEGCAFCDAQSGKRTRVVSENSLALIVNDSHPVTLGHFLVIPKRHAVDVFELTHAEVTAIWQLTNDFCERLKLEDPKISGYNIGANAGSVAGQSVFHHHQHVIPRRQDDVQNPRGGVRNLLGPTGY